MDRPKNFRRWRKRPEIEPHQETAMQAAMRATFERLPESSTGNREFMREWSLHAPGEKRGQQS